MLQHIMLQYEGGGLCFLAFAKSKKWNVLKNSKERARQMSVQGITVARDLGYGIEILNGNSFVYAVLSKL